MYQYLRKRLAVALLALGASALSACSSQGTDPFGGAAAGSASTSALQSSYAYNADSSPAFGESVNRDEFSPLSSSLKANQTLGFGADRLLLFDYKQQFDCVIGPFSDVDSIGKPADEAPQQFASPECVIGLSSELAPSGKTLPNTDTLFILVPFFETNKKTPAFTPQLGKALKKLFGFVPDAFKPDPGVAVQCPTPKDKPGTCTMHPLQINLGPLLVQLGLIPKGTNVYTPLVNHDHLLTNGTISQAREWWKLDIVLVEKPSAWPNAQGTMGITSVAKLRAAQANKEASADVPSNFFLFFSSYGLHGAPSGMPGMKM